MTLKEDVENTPGLKGHYRPGLQGVKAVDRARMTIVQPTGSVDVDLALQVTRPNDARWDYLIGRRKGRETLLHWVEVHPANGDHTIGEIEAKLQWLKTWIGGTPLRKYNRTFHWIASGKCPFNSRYPRLRSLAQQGLSFCGQHLSVGARDT